MYTKSKCLVSVSVILEYLPIVTVLHSLAPMLITLGYDPDAYPPHYGDADSEVLLLPPLSAASSVTLPAAN